MGATMLHYLSGVRRGIESLTGDELLAAITRQAAVAQYKRRAGCRADARREQDYVLQLADEIWRRYR